MKYLLLLILAIPNAYADYRHEYKAPTTSITGTNTNGTALAIAAAQQNFYWGTAKWQMSAGMGFYDDTGALSVGMGKVIDGVMINFNIGGTEGGEYGGGVGFTWIVK